MDLDISMRTVDCFFTVTFYGALFREVTELNNYLALSAYWRAWLSLGASFQLAVGFSHEA